MGAANDGSPAERCSQPGTGAAMSVAASGGGGSRCGCCCINIYVNNNVQGVTNSVLVRSKVAMRDPGARLRLRHPARPCCRSKRKEKAAATSMSPSATSVAMVFIATLLLLLLLLFCAWMCR
ncbi:hypothetical protein ABZP36_030146 [Zizania latifolia]